MFLPSIYFDSNSRTGQILEIKTYLPIKVIFTVCASINSLVVLHDDHTISKTDGL